MISFFCVIKGEWGLYVASFERSVKTKMECCELENCRVTMLRTRTENEDAIFTI